MGLLNKASKRKIAISDIADVYVDDYKEDISHSSRASDKETKHNLYDIELPVDKTAESKSKTLSMPAFKGSRAFTNTPTNPASTKNVKADDSIDDDMIQTVLGPRKKNKGFLHKMNSSTADKIRAER